MVGKTQLEPSKEIFETNHLDDMDVIKTLTEEELQQMGIDTIGDRRKIVMYAKQFDSQQACSTAFSSSTAA
jgi:hypothetical protein